MIDVVIPAGPKDLPTLERVVRAARRHLAPVRRVHVVSAQPPGLEADGVVWVPEPQLPAFPALGDVAARRPELTARAGWVYQQLLKLGAHAYVPDLADRYLVLDADVLFLRPVSFAFDPGTFPYSRATEHYPPYLDAYRRLLGEEPPGGPSFTAHHMLYDRALLAELLAAIEAHAGQPWHWAYVDAVDAAESSSINEQDTYGLWLLAHRPEALKHRQLRWKDARTWPGPVGRAALALDFDFVAVHAYGRETRAQRAREFALRLGSEVAAAAGVSRGSR